MITTTITGEKKKSVVKGGVGYPPYAYPSVGSFSAPRVPLHRTALYCVIVFISRVDSIAAYSVSGGECEYRICAACRAAYKANFRNARGSRLPPPRRVTNRGEAKLRTVINDGVLRGSHSQSRSPRAVESCLADEGNLRSPRTKANARVCNRASAEIRAGEAGGLRRGSRDHRGEGAARFAEAKNAFARSAPVSYSL